jgi:DNA primase
LEQIRAASDIIDVISAYTPLKRAGANFVGLCPFHREKTPSFNVSPGKQLFYCYGCGVGGNVFTFIQKYENIGFIDAVRRLAERARINIEVEDTPGQQEARHLKDQLLQVHEQITQRWQAALAGEASGQIARDYIARRGVSPEGVKLFRLGYAPDSWDDTVNWGRGRGFSPELLEQAGLVVRKEESNHFYDRFRGRLMFPICDEQGRVVGFSGRVLSGDEKTAKYVNSPESPIFTKGRVLYGLDKSKKDMLDKRAAIVCEGQLDLIACFISGTRNIVAPQGTAFTADHARILKRYADEVILCFDSDNAGQKAAARALDSLLAAGLAIRVAVVPAPHDPDSFIKENGGEAFARLIAEAEGFFDYYLGRLCGVNDAGSDKGRVAVVRAMAEAVLKTGDRVLIDTYAQKTALRLGVSTDAVRAEFEKLPAHETGGDMESEPEPDGQGAEPEPITRASAHEEWLLRLALENDDFIDWIAGYLDLRWVEHGPVRYVLSTRIQAYRDGNWPGLAVWLSELEDPALRNYVTQLLADDRRGVAAEVILKGSPQKPGVVQALRDKYLDRQIVAMRQQLANPDLDDERKLRLLSEMPRWRDQKRQPLSPLVPAGQEGS